MNTLFEEVLSAKNAKYLYIRFGDNIIIISDNMNLELKIVGLLARNKEKKLTINEIAKALGKHYSFVHKTINKLIDETIITRETAGKAHLCSLNLKHEKTKALLQLSEIEKKNEFYKANKGIKIMLEDLVKSIQQANKPLSIVLFGS